MGHIHRDLGQTLALDEKPKRFHAMKTAPTFTDQTSNFSGQTHIWGIQVDVKSDKGLTCSNSGGPRGRVKTVGPKIRFSSGIRLDQLFQPFELIIRRSKRENIYQK